ncbi:MAG: hypothetical protein RLY86_3332 [Pseudomonadota bacterium]|jgi:hypothetical protein
MTLHTRQFTDLLGYWRNKCRDGRMPSRLDVDPADLLPLLPSLYLLDVLWQPRPDGPGLEVDFRYRLVGTSVDLLHGRPLTGLTIRQAWTGPSRAAALDPLCRVLEDRAPILARFTVGSLSAPVRLESLCLPLSADGRAVDMVLGALLHRGGGDLPQSQGPGPDTRAGIGEIGVEIFPIDP